MSRANIVTIEHLEVKRTAIEKVKRFFKIKDDSEAVKMAVDVASGKIELENIFEKHGSSGFSVGKVKPFLLS